MEGDQHLCALAVSAGEELSLAIHMVCAVTTDAIYQETEGDVDAWRKQGAHIVNMETSPLYAASMICGLRSVWLGHVSDCLTGSDWEEWTDIEDMTIASTQIALEMLTNTYESPFRESDKA